MPYCTAAMVKDRADSLQGVDNAAFEGAIRWADARINGRLRARYPVPFATAPEEVAEVSADLAAYYYLFKRFIAGAEDTPVKAALELKQRAEQELALMLKGDITLTPPDAAAATSGMRSSSLGKTPSLQLFDGMNRPDICPPVAPLVPMMRSAPQTVDNMVGDL